MMAKARLRIFVKHILGNIIQFEQLINMYIYINVQ